MLPSSAGRLPLNAGGSRLAQLAAGSGSHLDCSVFNHGKEISSKRLTVTSASTNAEAKLTTSKRYILCHYWFMVSNPVIDRAVPNLPSRNFDRTEDFYGGFGFQRVFRDEDWMILARGGLQLEFFPAPDLDPLLSSFMCCLRVIDVDELYEAIRRFGVPDVPTGMPRLRPVRMQGWGLRAGFLVDPDGTQLTLIEQRA